MILVDSTIVSVATPALMQAFDTDINGVLWVTSGYLLAYAVPLLITGRLGDRVGPRRVYLTGLVIFTLASLACGLVGSLRGLVAARVVQGLGASLMTPQTMAVITRIFPATRRGGAMALWGATAGIATLVGPILGGILIDTLDWRWIFSVNVPVGLVAFLLCRRFVPKLDIHSHSFDIPGVILCAVGLFSAVFALQEAETFNWGTIWAFITVPGLLVLGVLVLIVFVWWQGRTPAEPLVPLGLFRDRNFSVANIAITTVSFAITGMIYPFMLYAQVVLGLSPTQAALITAPQAIIGFLSAPLVGRLIDRVHPRSITAFGLAGLVASITAYGFVMRPDTPLWVLLAVSTLLGISSSCVWGPLSTTANRDLDRTNAGAGAGVYNATRQFGAVTGSAAIAAMMGWTVSVTPGASPPGPTLDFSRALGDAMYLPAAVAALGLIAVLFFERPRHLMPLGRP